MERSGRRTRWEEERPLFIAPTTVDESLTTINRRPMASFEDKVHLIAVNKAIDSNVLMCAACRHGAEMMAVRHSERSQPFD